MRRCPSDVSDPSHLRNCGTGSRKKQQEETPALQRTSRARRRGRMEERSETIRSFQRSVRTETPGCPSESCWGCY